MLDLKDKIELYAPFLSHYWLQLLSIGIAFIIASFVKGYISKPRAEKDKSNTKESDEPIVQDSTQDSGFDPYNDHDEGKHIPYRHTSKMSETEMIKKAQDFYNFMNERRSVRFISKEPVPSLESYKDHHPHSWYRTLWSPYATMDLCCCVQREGKNK